MSILFENTKIKTMELKNRLVRSATHEGMSEGSYIAHGKSQGLNLSITHKPGYGPQPEGKDWGKGFAPGFEDDESGSD